MKPAALPYAATVIAVVWIACSRFEDGQDADSLLSCLVSTQHYSLYFWGQDRFGMLLPLIAMPLHHPLFNLLLQTTLAIGAMWLSLLFLARLVVPPDEAVPAASLAGIILIVSLEPVTRFLLFSTETPYGVSTALVAGGLLALPRSRAAGYVLALLGAWVSISSFLLFVPLVLLRPAAQPVQDDESDPDAPSSSRRAPVDTSGLLAVCAATAVAFGLSQCVHVSQPTSAAPLDPRLWPAGLATFFNVCTQQLATCTWAPLVALVIALGLAVRATSPRRPAVILLMTAAACWGLTGLSRHVANNSGSGAGLLKYALPAILAATAAAGICGARLLQRLVPPRLVPLICAGGIVIATAASFGRPGLDVVRETFERKWGAMAEDATSVGVTHFAGHFWLAVPQIYFLNQKLYERGENRMVWGLSGRMEGLLAEAEAAYPESRRCIVSVRGDPLALGFARTLCPLARPVRALRNLWIFSCNPQNPPRPDSAP